eukprot:TRINITY_DN103880_c0_g1_i1.p1 TRINITY_DN103880_c0_g1~~TRINITY_DN103880_c0_g1_i1.p1  ORF type:complete len:555 (-),score=117.03 TRINITY_DN103880_c0_g1_i1:82-1746(-)
MALRTCGAVSAAFVASLVGILELQLSATSPFRQMQRGLILGLDAALSSLQENWTSSVDWPTNFNGAMIPVKEASEVALEVLRGEIPADLQGVFLRVGPNLPVYPPSRRTHVFDGDGMIYSVRFKDGKAVYHGRFLETKRYSFEQSEPEWLMRVGEMNGFVGLTKMMTVARWRSKYAGIPKLEASTANTAIGLTPDDKVWALNEAGYPFRFTVKENGAIESLGFDDLKGSLKTAVSAHPKFDYSTKEVFYHSHDIENSAFHVGHIVDGKVQDVATLENNLPVAGGFHHDMFITADYVVIIDGSMRFSPKEMVKQGQLWDYNETRNLRFGVYPRSTRQLTSQAFVWIEADFPAEIVHTMAAYNEGSKIVLWAPACDYSPTRIEGVLGHMGNPKMKRFTIDVNAKTVVKESIEGGDRYISEFGRIRESKVGQKPAFAYSASAEPDDNWIDFNFTGMLKWDLANNKVAAAIRFPPGMVGGEPIYMPKGEAEDDGYLSLFLYNSFTKKSTFAVYDAKSFDQEPVVELAMPDSAQGRVPLGFHGWWLSEDDLRRQMSKAL